MATGKDVPLSLGEMTSSMVLLGNADPERRAAAITTAETAIADAWTRDDLVDVLGSLGLTDTTAVAS